MPVLFLRCKVLTVRPPRVAAWNGDSWVRSTQRAVREERAERKLSVYLSHDRGIGLLTDR